MHDRHERAIARAMYEYDGFGSSAIGRKLGRSPNTILTWRDDDDWGERGCKRQKLEKIESEAREEAARKAGLTLEGYFEHKAEIINLDYDKVFDCGEGGELQLKSFEKMNEEQPGITKHFKKIKENAKIVEDNNGNQIKYSNVEVELPDKEKAWEDTDSTLGWKQKDKDTNVNVNLQNWQKELSELSEGDDNGVSGSPKAS